MNLFHIIERFIIGFFLEVSNYYYMTKLPVNKCFEFRSGTLETFGSNKTFPFIGIGYFGSPGNFTSFVIK